MENTSFHYLTLCFRSKNKIPLLREHLDIYSLLILQPVPERADILGTFEVESLVAGLFIVRTAPGTTIRIDRSSKVPHTCVAKDAGQVLDLNDQHCNSRLSNFQ